MRCRYCHKLIIHRFNGNYTPHDKRKKQQHMRLCESNPANSVQRWLTACSDVAASWDISNAEAEAFLEDVEYNPDVMFDHEDE